MRNGLIGFLLGITTISQAQAAPINHDLSLPSSKHNCGTLQEIIERSKPVLSAKSVKTLRAGASFKVSDLDGQRLISREFVFDFYLKNGEIPEHDYKTLDEWLKYGSFDGFSVYELDNQGEKFENSSVDVFFERGLMLVIYDLVTIAQDGSVLNKPDSYAEYANCYLTLNATKSELLMEILIGITSFRVNHPN